MNTKPLAGVKVVGLVMNLPGPLVLWRLSQMGATTVKVEPPQGDALGHFFPDLYQKLSAGQEVLRQDLKDREKLHSILRDADLLVTTLRPSTLEKLGLNWEKIQETFPKLSHVSITGYGGADESWAGHDLTYQASKGFVQPPNLPFNCWSDLAGAQESVIQSLLLIKQSREGKAAHAQVSLAEALEFYAIPMDYGMFGAKGALTGMVPTYQVYPAKDGWVALAILEPHFQEKFQKLAETDDLSAENLTRLFSAKSADQWESWAKAHDLPIAKVRQR
jgi:alpha-methylacyl-CoA racemase